MAWFEQKKILFVLNSLVENGGAERRTLDQVLYFREQGFYVDVCVLRHVGEMAERYRTHGIRVFYFRAYETYDDRRVKFFPINFVHFLFFILRGRYAIVIGTQPPSHYLVRFACFPPMGRKIFTIERGDRFYRKKKYYFWDRFCSLWTEKIICVSKATRDGLIEVSGVKPEKLVAIEEGYKKTPCKEVPVALEESLKERYVFGYVGGLIPTKRPDVLIKAFKLVNDRFPEMRLVLIGAGVMGSKLRSMVKDLQIEDRVIFAGSVENPHCYYPLFDAFIFPSVLEGLGGVFVEAWFHKLPVICSDMRPMNDYIIHMKNGLLFKPDDVEDLAKWMEYLYSHRDAGAKMGEAGYRVATETFDYERQLKRLFQQVVG